MVVLAISFVLMVSGAAFSLLVEVPWDDAVASWYEGQRLALHAHGCSLAGLNDQVTRLEAGIDLVRGVAYMGGGGILLVWGIQYARGKL